MPVKMERLDEIVSGPEGPHGVRVLDPRTEVDANALAKVRALLDAGGIALAG